MAKIEWRAGARGSLFKILDYISDDNPDAAQQLKDDIQEKVAGLLTHPAMYRQGRVPGTRELVVRDNYIVVYAYTGERVTIIQVLHAAQQWP